MRAFCFYGGRYRTRTCVLPNVKHAKTFLYIEKKRLIQAINSIYFVISFYHNSALKSSFCAPFIQSVRVLVRLIFQFEHG